MQNEMMLRLFIAAQLAPGFSKKFGEVQHELSKAKTRMIWVKPENMHITVKFIGDYPASQIGRLTEIVEDSLDGLIPKRLTFKGVSFFPNNRNPRVIKIGLSDETNLLEQSCRYLEEDLADEIKGGVGKSFVPHITLGRLKNTAGIPELVEIASRYEETVFGSMDVSSLTIFASKLSRRGPDYSVVAEIDIPD